MPSICSIRFTMFFRLNFPTHQRIGEGAQNSVRIVNNHVGTPKTFARRNPVPLAKEVVTALEEWRGRTAYAAESNWVFASECMKGESPVWRDPF